MNTLAPTVPGPSLNSDSDDSGTGAPASDSGIHDALLEAHDSAKSLFDHASMMQKRMETVTQELNSLAKMGASVTSEDVISGVGKLVAAGSDPMKMAGVLADMPDGGEALQAWVAQHAQQQQQVQQHYQQLHVIAQHEMGASALRALAGHLGGLPGLPAMTEPEAGGGPLPQPAPVAAHSSAPIFNPLTVSSPTVPGVH